MIDYEGKMDQYLEKIEELVRSKKYADLRDKPTVTSFSIAGQ